MAKMPTLTPEQWREWGTHPCSKALMCKVFSIHMPYTRNWFLQTEPDEMIRSQGAFRQTNSILGFVSENSKRSTRDICAEAGFDPDQLSE